MDQFNFKNIYKEKETKQIKEFCAQFKKIYLYGAGMYAAFMVNCLHDIGIDIEGILVSEPENNGAYYKGYKVWGVSELQPDEDYEGGGNNMCKTSFCRGGVSIVAR